MMQDKPKSSRSDRRLNTREHIDSLNAMSGEIKRYLGALRPIKLRTVDEINIRLPPPRPEFTVDVTNALRVCEIFRKEAEKLRPPEKRKDTFLH